MRNVGGAKCAVIMSSRVGPGDASTAGAGRSSRMPHNRFPHVWVNLETDPAAAAVLGHHGLSPEHSARPCQTWVAQQPRVGFRRAGDVRRRELTVPPGCPPRPFEFSLLPGAPLRNRTVDLLLTMDQQDVSLPAARALIRENIGTWQRWLAPAGPREHHSAPQIAPEMISPQDRRNGCP